MVSAQSGINIFPVTANQLDTVHNPLSLVIASLALTALCLLLFQRRVTPRYGNAVVSTFVCGIAAHHCLRIFDNFKGHAATGRLGRRSRALAGP